MPRRRKDPAKKSNVASRARRRTKAGWTRRLDELCRILVFRRDGLNCVLVGQGGLQCKGRLEWCHVDSRRFLSTRWYPQNSFVACSAHHFFWHDRPRLALEWWSGTYPERSLFLASHPRVVKPQEMEAHLIEDIREYEPDFGRVA